MDSPEEKPVNVLEGDAKDRHIATTILANASDAVGKSRGPTHGGIVESFEFIADLWNTYLNGVAKKRNGDGTLDATDVLEMMAMMKQARRVFGDQFSMDHYIDGAGYVAMAGAVATHYRDEGAK